MQVTVSDEMNANRSTLSSSRSSNSPATKHPAAAASGEPGRPIDGLFCAASPPRARTERERNAITTMITMKGTASDSPDWGSHVQTVISLLISDWKHPISRPASAVIQNDSNRPTRAAASAGTMNSVYEVGSRLATGAIRIPAAPARTVAITQFCAATRLAEMPVSAAPRAFSAPALVASPKRVKR